MLASPWIAALFAVFAWWFFTGAILLIVRRSDAGEAVAHARSVFLTVPLAALGFAGLLVSSAEMTLANVYLSFLSVLLIWGWIELAFLAGIITGPERRDCPPGLHGSGRFVRAWNTVAHHELLLFSTLLVIIVMSSGAANTFGLWAYVILFVARISAKLNLFFGVPKINTEFVPLPLTHIKSYFRKGSVTFAFPIGITLLTFGAACFAERLIAAETAPYIAGFALLTALSTLAIVEHWLMVIPLPDAKLWRWMLPAPTRPQDKTHEL